MGIENYFGLDKNLVESALSHRINKRIDNFVAFHLDGVFVREDNGVFFVPQMEGVDEEPIRLNDTTDYSELMATDRDKRTVVCVSTVDKNTGMPCHDILAIADVTKEKADKAVIETMYLGFLSYMGIRTEREFKRFYNMLYCEMEADKM